MDPTLILPFLTAFGLGSIVTAAVQYWLKVRSDQVERSYSERREAYIGLLDALRRAEVEDSVSAVKNFAYWKLRCELVAPRRVRIAIHELQQSKPETEQREAALKSLKLALREDLGISAR